MESCTSVPGTSMSGRETVEACPVCGAIGFVPDEYYPVDDDVFGMCRCSACGLGIVTPRPTREAMGAFYEGFPHASWGRTRGLKRGGEVLIAAAVRAEYGDGGSISRQASRVTAPLWRPVWRSWLRKAHLGAVDRPGRVLDVGCAAGAWLANQRRWGFEVFGCEPDAAAGARARSLGIDVQFSDLLSADFEDAFFDVIHFNHVLEHCHLPAENVRRAAELLRPGGMLVIVVPNGESAVARAYRRVEDVPRHLWSFTGAHLERLTAEAGLEVHSTTTESPDPWGSYSALWRATDEALSGAGGDLEANRVWWTSRRIKRKFRTIGGYWDDLGLGYQVVCTARKPAVSKRAVAEGTELTLPRSRTRVVAGL